MTTDLPGDPSAHPTLDAAPPAVAPAGWHPDPMVAGQQRYWDGTAWTTHTAPGAALPPPTPVPAPAAPGAPSSASPLGPAGRLRQLPTWTKVAAGVTAVALVAGGWFLSREPVTAGVGVCSNTFMEVKLENTSSGPRVATVEIAWYQDGVRLADNAATVGIPAGQTARPQLESVFELPRDVDCKVLKVQSDPSE